MEAGTPPSEPRRGAEGDRRIGRAAFLGAVAAGVGGIFVASAFPGVGGGLARLLPGAVGDLVPGGGWRIYAVAPPFPVFDPATYRLSVTGLVERPRTFTWAELAELPAARQVSDFHCVTGWSVYDVRWEGIRPATIIDLVRPKPEARHVTVFSMEGPYVDQVTMDQFTLPDVLLARTLDDRPLSRPQGAPMRLVIPRMYGYKGPKWVREIRFDARPGLGYWEQRGYDKDAWVGRSNGYGRS